MLPVLCAIGFRSDLNLAWKVVALLTRILLLGVALASFLILILSHIDTILLFIGNISSKMSIVILHFTLFVFMVIVKFNFNQLTYSDMSFL